MVSDAAGVFGHPAWALIKDVLKDRKGGSQPGGCCSRSSTHDWCRQNFACILHPARASTLLTEDDIS